MNQFYLFSFIPVITLSLVMWISIYKRPEYGKRPKLFFVSIILFTVIAVLFTTMELFSEKAVPDLRMLVLFVSLLLYTLSFFFLEYSVHYQRIELSYLTDDVKPGLRMVRMITLACIGLIIAFIVLYFISPIVDKFVFYYLIILLLVLFNIIMIFNLFNFRKGVLRKMHYPFVINLIILLVYMIMPRKWDLLYPIMVLLNLAYIVRGYQEYIFFRSKHMQSLFRKQEQRQEVSTELVNRIILSDRKEDTYIIRDVISNAMNNMKSELIVKQYGITGILTYRLFKGTFRIDSSDLIDGYCTPLYNMAIIKKQNQSNLQKCLLETHFELQKILETPIGQLSRFGEIYIKRIIQEKDIVVMDSIPKCYKGLQKMIAFVPIFNSDQLSGFQVIYKDSYDKLFPHEKNNLIETGYNLNTIFSIVNGKQVQDERNRLMSEMNIAKDIQTSIVPKSIELDGYTVACNMLTATEVGGDAYDFIQSKFGNYFSIGDVSGHGLPSGIMALIFLSTLQAAIATSEELNSELAADKAYDIVNKILCTINRDRIGSDKFMTGNIFRELEGTFHFAGAHEIALQYSKVNDAVIQHKDCTERTAFLGLSKHIKSVTSIGKLVLESGDILVLYTDGVIEAKNEYDEQFGIEKLQDIILVNKDSEPADILEMIMDSVLKFAKKGDIAKYEGDLADDITLVVIKKN